jgi:parallel beta-helix repeat protein
VIRKPGITLRSVPGERATWKGRIVIKAPRVTIKRLNLDGTRGPRCPSRRCYSGEHVLPSPTVNGPHARLIEDDITNRRGICLNFTHYYGRSPRGFRVLRNRIHDCRPADNHIHGVYIVAGRHGLVRGNVIYANGDKGIVLYPNARDETIEQNTIDGNRTGVHFGGGDRSASSRNIVTRNVISFPRPRDGWPARFNVEYYWPGPAGRGNVVRDNCLFSDARDAYFSGDPPRSGVIPQPRGVSVLDDVVADPGYVDRSRADYRLADGSPCAGLGAPPAIASANAWCDQVDPPGARHAAYETLWHAPRRSCFGPRP